MFMSVTNTKSFPKTPTGINGLDEITSGGFPEGRPILICGGPGCGKTMMAMQFLVKGITDFGEPGVFMSFEESASDLAQNFLSLGFNLDKLRAEKKLNIDYVRIDSSQIEETGEYDLEGLFVRLNYAIDSIGAKRVVLDTIESLFGGLSNTGIIRSEIRRLFQWLKNKGVTSIITGEKGEATLTRQGLEEYVSDCVILLDFRMVEQIATRRLRILKYRGSSHGTNEYPFLIDNNGISVMPITSLKLDYESSNEIITTGLPALDKQFSKEGLYRGTLTLVTGSAGTAKTILAWYYAMSSCLRKEPVLYFSFEESPGQLVNYAKTLNLDFNPMIQEGLFHIYSSRPSLHGLEMHLLTILKYILEIKPRMVILDPISSLVSIGSENEVRAMLIRLLDMLKSHQINTLFTSLEDSKNHLKSVGEIYTFADTWIELSNQMIGNERHRSLLIVKSRGMGHNTQEQRFIITDKGLIFE